MNSKERVLCAVNMEKVDRIPSDFQAVSIVLERLYEHFQIDKYYDLLDKLCVDIVDIRGIVDPLWVADFDKRWHIGNGVYQNYLGWQMKSKQTDFGPVEEHCGYILSEYQTLEEIKQYNWPKVEWFDFSNMKKELEQYKDFAVMASGASVYQHPSLVRGLDNILCDMLIDPEIADFIIGKFTDFYMDYFDKMFTECKGMIDIFRIGDDLGMQDRMMISMELFDKYFAPNISKLCDMAHSYGVKVMFHSCGAIYDYIPNIIKAGVDILDPIQTAAKGMEPSRLRDSYLGEICLHGSIDTQFTLPTGSPEDVANEVRNNIEILGSKNTGFIIAPSHILQSDVKTENILALYDTVRNIQLKRL